MGTLAKEKGFLRPSNLGRPIFPLNSYPLLKSVLGGSYPFRLRLFQRGPKENGSYMTVVICFQEWSLQERRSYIRSPFRCFIKEKHGNCKSGKSAVPVGCVSEKRYGSVDLLNAMSLWGCRLVLICSSPYRVVHELVGAVKLEIRLKP